MGVAALDAEPTSIFGYVQRVVSMASTENRLYTSHSHITISKLLGIENLRSSSIEVFPEMSSKHDQLKAGTIWHEVAY